MCLATVYKNVKEEESILIRNASRIDIDDRTIRIVDIMGSEVVVEGNITMIDLANSIVKINCAE